MPFDGSFCLLDILKVIAVKNVFSLSPAIEYYVYKIIFKHPRILFYGERIFLFKGDDVISHNRNIYLLEMVKYVAIWDNNVMYI